MKAVPESKKTVQRRTKFIESSAISAYSLIIACHLLERILVILLTN
jgi:hypothetical protein